MKIFKRILFALLALLVVLVLVIFLYKDKLIRETVNNFNANYNITIDYKNVSIGFIKGFPKANLAINELSIINDTYRDTLFYAETTTVALDIKDLFKHRNDTITIQNFTIDKAKIKLLVNKEGVSTFDIKPNNQSTNTSNENEASNRITIKQYSLRNSSLIYNDNKGAILVKLDSINHSGNASFDDNKIGLDTKTTIASLSSTVGNITYINKAKIALNAVMAIDLDAMKFEFKENEAHVNDLPLLFNGFIQIMDTKQVYDVAFSSPNANFKNVLSLVPNAYTNDFASVKANGNATISGFFKGNLSDTEFPKYQLKINTENASVKYADLPKTIKNINFDGSISNKGANNEDIDFFINTLKLSIDEDTFQANGSIHNLLTNPSVSGVFDGVINLANLSKAYPVSNKEVLSGILKANFKTKFDKKAIDSNDFERIKSIGDLSLSNFTYKGDALPNTANIKGATVSFNNKNVQLKHFDISTGKSDLKATGNIENLYAFLMNDKKLKGNFDIHSKHFEVNDFLSSAPSTTSATESSEEALEIPDFLDISTNFNAQKVVYDNINMTAVSGLLKINDQKVILKNTKANMLDGAIAMNGLIDTKKHPTYFDLDMNIDKFSIANSFETLETFKKLIPIAKLIQGKYTTKFKIDGQLNNDLFPELTTLSGFADAKVFVNKMNKNSLPLLKALNSNLNFIDFDKINFDNLKTYLSFENGTVHVKPFTLNYKDIKMHVSGSHSFDEKLDYQLTMDIPAKYLGDKAVTLLAQLSNTAKDTLRIPLKTTISGNMLKPTIFVDKKAAFKTLSTKIIAYQKEKLTNQVTAEVNSTVNNAIDNILNPNGNKPKDSTTTDSTSQQIPKVVTDTIIKQGVNDIINIFKKKKKP